MDELMPSLVRAIAGQAPGTRVGLRKGRGAVSNPASRFDSEGREAADDGWWQDDDLPPLKTTITHDATRTIIARNDSPDIPFDRSINPYRGCEHGCIYCFARPSHAYLGLSPGLDFETKLLVKPDGARLLDAELREGKYRCAPIALGTNTDPYQPIERELRITRQVLEVLERFSHPFSIVTNSVLVGRDLDILRPMAARNLACVFVSVTTLEPELARKMEPRASAPHRRLETIRQLAKAGVPTGVMAAPMIPGLNDHELDRILDAARVAGATRAAYTLLRLPHEIKDLFAQWLEAHAPLRAKHVLNLVKQTRGGRLNDPEFGSRMVGAGPYAQLIAARFRLASERIGFDRTRLNLDTSQFKTPPRQGDQLTLL